MLRPSLPPDEIEDDEVAVECALRAHEIRDKSRKGHAGHRRGDAISDKFPPCHSHARAPCALILCPCPTPPDMPVIRQ